MRSRSTGFGQTPATNPAGSPSRTTAPVQDPLLSSGIVEAAGMRTMEAGSDPTGLADRVTAEPGELGLVREAEERRILRDLNRVVESATRSYRRLRPDDPRARLSPTSRLAVRVSCRPRPSTARVIAPKREGELIDVD